ncbi:MAG: PAS domain S-box protein [Lachnospiraceae bacterium]|nr:PAS domain S-box protein [Lachnospiraceae bacterium]
MDNKRQIIYENIVENISDGLLAIDQIGTIQIANPSAVRILGIEADRLVGHKLVEFMMADGGNDDFFQCLLDAVYSKELTSQVVPYVIGGEEKRLRVVSSLLMHEGEKVGLIVTFSDLTTMVQLSEKNEALNKELTEFIDRFVQVMISAIEARTPYNANHTKSMVRYGSSFLDWEKTQGMESADDIRKPFLASVWLHDIGKLVVPRSVMDKATRLGNREKDVLHRIETAILCEKLRMARIPSEEQAAKEQIRVLESAREVIRTANTVGFLNDELLSKVEALGSVTCLSADGERIPLLLKDELESLCVRRGTLTLAERKIIESHVVRTREMLDQMGFVNVYGPVSNWAGNHHEYLNGSGYPRGLKDGEISWESRLLTILDIYDSLTADDRPYKPAASPEQAFEILRSMSREGKLDGDLVEAFFESQAWKQKDA